MEERRSIHSLRTSRSNPGSRPLYDITYIDEEGGGSGSASGTPAPQPTVPVTKRSTSDQSMKNKDVDQNKDDDQNKDVDQNNSGSENQTGINYQN